MAQWTAGSNPTPTGWIPTLQRPQERQQVNILLSMEFSCCLLIYSTRRREMQFYLMLGKECDTIMNLDKLKNLKLFLRNNEIDGLSGCLIGITLHLVWLV